MHCKSCEILIEENLKDLPGVQSADAVLADKSATISFNGKGPTEEQIKDAVKAAGYEVGYSEKAPLISRDPRDYFRLAFAAGILFLLYIVAQKTGLFSIDVASQEGSIGVVALVGLVAGFSSCMALIGGLVLGMSARHSELHPEATPLQKFRPHIFFNLGRIIGYGIFGGLIGLLGSTLNISGSTLGFLTIIAGFVMIFLGLKLIEIFPALSQKSISLPKSLSRILGIKHETKEYSHKGALVAGAMTFFLPCGFTQAMQLYAVSTGSFMQGMLIMSAFAIGTAPGLLGIGGLSSIFKGKKAKTFFVASGLAVIALGIFNISSASKIVTLGSGSIVSAEQKVTPTSQNQTVAPVNSSLRVLKSAYTNDKDMIPSSFTLTKGQEVRIEVDVKESAYGCMSTIGIPGLYNKMQLLRAGKVIVMQFTPTKSGTYPITCAMGVPRGSIVVK